jgi:hypothetical protein
MSVIARGKRNGTKQGMDVVYSCVASRCQNSYVNLRLVLGTDCIHGGYLSTFDCCAVAFRWFKRFHSRPRGTLQQQKGETDVKPPAAKKAKTTFSFQDAD